MKQNELFTSEETHKRKPLTEGQRKIKREWDREYKRKWYVSLTEEQKKKRREHQRKWYASLTEEQKKKKRERRRKWVASLDLDQCRNKKIANMYFQAKNRAENKDLPFNITRQDIADVWPKDDYCPALRIPLKIKGGNKISTDNSPNLDRVIPILGYVKGNIAVVSKLANSIMSSARPSEVIKVGKWFDEKYYEVKDKLNV
jgi:DNA-binding MarR family transcriptional regulator